MAGKKARTVKSRPRTNVRSKTAKKGDKFVCDECGFSLVVEEPCGCDDGCDLACCSTPMAWVGCC